MWLRDSLQTWKDEDNEDMYIESGDSIKHRHRTQLAEIWKNKNSMRISRGRILVIIRVSKLTQQLITMVEGFGIVETAQEHELATYLVRFSIFSKSGK